MRLLKPTTPASAIRDGQTTTARFRLKQPARLAIPETPAEGRSLNVLASAPPMATLAEGMRRLGNVHVPARQRQVEIRQQPDLAAPHVLLQSLVFTRSGS